MSLKVWLPLTKDLRQQGLSDVTVTNNGAAYESSGKLGGCYNLTNGPINITNLPNPTSISVAFWFKRTANTNTRQFMFTAWSGVTCELTTDGKPTFAVYRNSYPTITGPTAITTSTGWIHYCGTFSPIEGMKMYLNGELVASNTNTTAISWSTTTGQIGKYSSYASMSAQMNDFRLYDHCLSPMEVKELAKGLVLHYPLNRGGLGPSNLLKNGFGELDSENWDNNTNISTSDIPSGQSDIKASFSNGRAIEHIKLYPTHTYKFTTWIKATATSGNTYPSLFPYDVDGKFINNYNCPDGFNLTTMTTLKQALKTGDTKIYVNDLSQWNANSGHYYNWAAIFSYIDGTGQTYPDGTYTQNMARFGSSTNAKTNLDKTNNIITLLSAYTGPTMPIGTKICASTEGSTYFYPWGGFNLANIQNWTYKETTVSGNANRLKYADYVTFWTYSSNRMAGIKIADLTNEEMDSTTEYDCSGFCNNGTRTGTFDWTSNTAKYAVSTKFNGTDNAIQTPSLPTMITDKNYTIAVWIYKTVIGSKGYQTIYGGPSGFEIEARNGSANETKFVPWNWGKPMASYELNEWNHCVFVHSDADCKIYLNGEYIATGTAKASNPTGNYFVGAWNTATQQNFDGLMSDFRIYATALSADDVKSLYQNCATIDPDGTIRGQIRS